MLPTLFILPLLLTSSLALGAAVPPANAAATVSSKSRAGHKRGNRCPRKSGVAGGSTNKNGGLDVVVSNDNNDKRPSTNEPDVSHLQVGGLEDKEVKFSNKQVQHPGNEGVDGGSDRPKPGEGDKKLQPKPSQGAEENKAKGDKPKDDKPKDDKPKDSKPKDEKPKDPEPEQKPSSNTSGGKGDSAVGTGWDVAQNSADLSTYVANGLGWYYEWKLVSKWSDSGAEFVPMVWGPDDVPKVQEAKGKWAPSTKHVLSFNEPDINKGQAGEFLESTAQAAQLHNRISATLGSGIQLSSPAVATGLHWLEEFEAECKKTPEGSCRYDFVAYHFYGVEAGGLIDMLKQLHERFGKKIWLTEWGCHVFGENPYSCTSEEADKLMLEAISWFRGEGKDIVERWAWFGAFRDMTNWQGQYQMDANRIANADGTINGKGKMYLSL